MTITDRRYGVLSGVAMKAPCRVATTAAITLSGLQSIDGVTTVADDRVLVKDQSDPIENGIYVASSGTWTRAGDFDSGDDVVTGTAVIVSSGSTNSNTLYRATVDSDFEIDEDSVTFSLFINYDGREILAAARTYYVRTDGSNSNTGLADTAGGAFLTVQKAIDTAAQIDFAGYTVTIQIAAGTYTTALTIGPNVGQTDADNFIITGASATETDFVISTTSANCFTIEGGAVTIKRLKLQTTTTGHAIRATVHSSVKIEDLNFGAVASGYDHISVDGWSRFEAAASYAISGGAHQHISATRGQYTAGSITVTISNTPAFTQFIYAGPYGHVSIGSVTWSGSATGDQYLTASYGTIDTGNGSLTAIPGDSAGTVTSRPLLTAARTYYVRTDGSDLNDGLTDSSGGAFLTIQKAVDAAALTDFNGFAVTIQVGAGTYTGAVTIGNNVGQVAREDFILTGASATETDFIISTTSESAVTVQDRGSVTIKRLKLQTTTAGHALRVTDQSDAVIDDLNFGAVASGYGQISIDSSSTVYASGNYTISGGGYVHLQCSRGGGFTSAAITVTISGTPAFDQFVYAVHGWMSLQNITWSGSATGPRFNIADHGAVYVGSGSATALPGDAAGTIWPGGGGVYGNTSAGGSISGYENAKLWGVVTVSAGTPTLQSPSHNITSITDTDVGRLTVTIATDFADVHYALTATVERAATALTVANLRNCVIRNASLATGTFEIECYDNTAVTALAADPASWHFAAFGTQL
jgi:hypothetical protein